MSVGHHFLDPQGESRRLLVALDGRVKLVLMVAGLGVNLVAGGLRAPLLLALLALALIRLAGVPQRAYLQRMLVPGLLALTALVTQLFWFAQGEVLVSWTLFDWTLVVRAGALARGLELAARIVGGMSVLLFFALTTPLPELMRAARFFRCPSVLVEPALIMYRYIFLLMEEGVRIRNAERARLGFVSLRSSLRSAGILGGMLLLRTFDRAERSFEAMRCRGYRGVLTVVTPSPMKACDWVVLALGLGMLGGLYLLR